MTIPLLISIKKLMELGEEIDNKEPTSSKK